MRKYVHRVGRTARAGREGYAWTLVEEQEVRTSLFYFVMRLNLMNLTLDCFSLLNKRHGTSKEC
jgi:superfamily II DNA/RNA helicase